MSVLKSEIKQLTAQEIGAAIEKQHEASKIEVHRLEGARGALSQAEGNLESVKNVWKKDLDADEAELAKKYASPEEAQKVLQAVIKAVEQCQGCLQSLVVKAEAQKLIKQGEVIAFDKALDACEGMFAREKAKVETLLKAVDSGAAEVEEDGTVTSRESGRGRPTGARPPSSLAARRKSAEKKDAAAESPSEASPDVGQGSEESVNAAAAETADRAKDT